MALSLLRCRMEGVAGDIDAMAVQLHVCRKGWPVMWGRSMSASDTWGGVRGG